MVPLADALQVIEIEEEGHVSLVGLDMVHDCCVVTGSAFAEIYAASLVLASVAVSE